MYSIHMLLFTFFPALLSNYVVVELAKIGKLK